MEFNHREQVKELYGSIAANVEGSYLNLDECRINNTLYSPEYLEHLPREAVAGLMYSWQRSL